MYAPDVECMMSVLLQMHDCGCYKHCKDKKKNGGPGQLRKACIKKMYTAVNSANSKLTAGADLGFIKGGG